MAASALTVACADGSPVPAPESWRVEEVRVSTLDPGGMPHLSSNQDGVLLSWLSPADPSADPPGRSHVLRVAEWADGQLGPPREVVRAQDFFVNWADFPSVVPVGGGRWVAHWLQRGGGGTYDYSVQIAESVDGGRSWTHPVRLHDDASSTEHGFVTLWPEEDGGWGALWLDGRATAAPAATPTGTGGASGSPDHTHGGGAMTVRARRRTPGGAGTPEGLPVSVGGRPLSPGGRPGSPPFTPEALVDSRSCDCCQTDVAWTTSGPAAVYRDRTPSEVRDIVVSRRLDGRWTRPSPVHRDGWVIEGCPVNGPSIDARGDTVVVAWFTAAQDDPRTLLAFSVDGGVSFTPPLRLDTGGGGAGPSAERRAPSGSNPGPVSAGRTDVVLLSCGLAVTVWLETEPGAGAVWRMATARLASGSEPGITPASKPAASLAKECPGPQGPKEEDLRAEPGASWTLARTTAARASGFPQLVGLGGDTLLAAWTDVDPDGPGAPQGSRVRLARVLPPASGSPSDQPPGTDRPPGPSVP